MSIVSRPVCSKCAYPKNACLCASIRPLSTEIELIILQDPSEVKQAKSSVKLMQAVCDKLQVFVGETSDDFVELQGYLAKQSKPILLLYPSECSQSLNEFSQSQSVILLLLDGTWKKAYKLLQLNPWLHQFHAVHLNLDSPSNYTIRKAKRSDSLSTLEAAAMAIQILEPMTDISPLTDALLALIEQHLSAMPAEVRQRYLS